MDAPGRAPSSGEPHERGGRRDGRARAGPAAPRAARRAARLRALGPGQASATRCRLSTCPTTVAIPEALLRAEIEGETQVSEVEIARHFTRLSRLNFSIDQGLYPLGLLHDEAQPADERGDGPAARLRGVAPAGARRRSRRARSSSRGGSSARSRSSRACSRVTLQPSAGAQGELAGILMVRRALEKTGRAAHDRPDSRLRARHESRLRALRGLQGQGAQVERPRHDRPRACSRRR